MGRIRSTSLSAGSVFPPSEIQWGTELLQLPAAQLFLWSILYKLSFLIWLILGLSFTSACWLPAAPSCSDKCVLLVSCRHCWHLRQGHTQQHTVCSQAPRPKHPRAAQQSVSQDLCHAVIPFGTHTDESFINFNWVLLISKRINIVKRHQKTSVESGSCEFQENVFFFLFFFSWCTGNRKSFETLFSFQFLSHFYQ